MIEVGNYGGKLEEEMRAFFPSSSSLALFEALKAFVKFSTLNFDASHNWVHALEVTKNALLIANDSEFSQINTHKLLIASMLHDVCDDKYKDKSISNLQLQQFIESIVPTVTKLQDFPNSSGSSNDYVAEVLNIIGSVSFSKQVKKQTHELTLNPSDLLILKILRDADRIEAIGMKGIQRCYVYTKENLSKDSQNESDSKRLKTATQSELDRLVIQHCHEKLLKLYEERYISTDAGRAIALPLHKEVVDFVRSFENPSFGASDDE